TRNLLQQRNAICIGVDEGRCLCLAKKPGPLGSAKREELVLQDRTADNEAILVLVEAGLRPSEEIAAILAIQRIQSRTGIQFPNLSMKLIRAGLGDQVNHATARATELGRRIVRVHNRVLKDEGHLRLNSLPGDRGIVNLLSIDQEVVGARSRSADL